MTEAVAAAAAAFFAVCTCCAAETRLGHVDNHESVTTEEAKPS